jgi:hypothetical protein
MRRFGFVWAGLFLVTAASPGQSQAPVDWTRDIAITPEVGPWTISSAYFSGEMGAKLAHDLVVELRTQYHLPAYVYNRGEEQRREQEREIQDKRRQHEEYLKKAGLNPGSVPFRIRRVRIEDQYIVLIGGYKDMDSAHKECERIKKLQPPKSVPADTLYQSPLAAPANGKQDQLQQVKINPLSKSFVTRNPTVPVQREAANKPDPFWKQLNANESFSLLKCKKPWTLAIKEFQGAVMVQPQNTSSSFLEKLFGNKTGEQLNASAMNAHNLAEALHTMHFDAFVLHTRTSSIVTVGGFDNANDPRMESVKQAVRDLHLGSNHPSFPTGVELFAQPMPMEVPRL